MCIVYIAKNVSPTYPLVIAANRDEFYERPTEAPHWWADAPHLFAGKDLQAGGTWLGYNRLNRFAGITNLRRPDLYQTGAKSRGDLVKRFLDIDTQDTAEAVAEFSDFLVSEYRAYNPFNLVFGDVSNLNVFSSADGVSRRLGDGVHSLSNGAPDEIWYKMKRGSAALNSALTNDSEEMVEEVFSVLSNCSESPINLLPSTGITVEEERQLSSIFVPEVYLRGKAYGTRSSSVIWAEASAEMQGLVMKSRMHN